MLSMTIRNAHEYKVPEGHEPTEKLLPRKPEPFRMRRKATANTNADLMAATVDYAKTRTVFEGYKTTKYSRKYYAEHEGDIELHRAA